MTSLGKAQVLAGIRAALDRSGDGTIDHAAAAERLRLHPRNLVPARTAGLDRGGLADLFARLSVEGQATVARVADLSGVPDAIAGYLAEHNMPAELLAAEDPLLARIDWSRRPLLRVSAGVPTGAEAVGLAAAACAIAETGTLMLTSGSGRPASLNFLPETFLAVLPVNRIAPALEDAWDRLRRLVPGTLPRTVNFINGPSRTGDIEQKLQMGAHGPRRVHILMIEDGALD